MWENTIQYDTTWHITIEQSTIWHNMLWYDIMECAEFPNRLNYGIPIPNIELHLQSFKLFFRIEVGQVWLYVHMNYFLHFGTLSLLKTVFQLLDCLMLNKYSEKLSEVKELQCFEDWEHLLISHMTEAPRGETESSHWVLTERPDGVTAVRCRFKS